MGAILDTLIKVAKATVPEWKKTFFESGKTGYLKFIIFSYYAIWLFHFFLRHRGWLPKKSVKGQHIFITGAGSGIGASMAKIFAKLGAKVTVADVNLDGAQKVADEIKSAGGQAYATYCNVAVPDSVREAGTKSVEAFGEVDILINNAGIVSGKKVLEVDDKSIERTMMVNTASHGYTVKQFLPKMLEKNKGHIVTIASCAGIVGVCGLTDYCASKFGAFGFDEALRMELRKLKSNVKTTCICPYFINTGMFDGVKTRFSFLLPIMSQEYASRRIVNAILQDEKVLIMPNFPSFTFLVRGLVHTSLFDRIQEFFGISNSMDEFKGRHGK